MCFKMVGAGVRGFLTRDFSRFLLGVGGVSIHSFISMIAKGLAYIERSTSWYVSHGSHYPDSVHILSCSVEASVTSMILLHILGFFPCMSDKLNSCI